MNSPDLILSTLVKASSHNSTEIAAYLIGGPIGITASMWAHRRTLGKPRTTTMKGNP